MIELSTIAEINGFHESQIALVDDYYENLGNAEKWDLQHFLLWKLLIWLIAFKIQIWKKC